VAPRLQKRIGVEHARGGGDGGTLSIGVPEYQAELLALGLQKRKISLRRMGEIRRAVLGRLGQSDPSLQPREPVGRRQHIAVDPLGMGDAVTRRHQVDRAGLDPLVGAEAVAMVELALEEIGHRRQADVGMRTNVDPLPGEKLRRSHLVEEDERPEHLARARRQGAADFERAQIPGAGDDDGLDRVHVHPDRIMGIENGVPAHGRAP
jgi:hypothetical protein